VEGSHVEGFHTERGGGGVAAAGRSSWAHTRRVPLLSVPLSPVPSALATVKNYLPI